MRPGPWCDGLREDTVVRMADPSTTDSRTTGTPLAPGVGPAALGRYGEQVAADHLVAAGMVLLDRNWRCREGELDLVARDVDGTVVFVEVKTRSGTGFGEPSEAVGRVKAARVRALALRWLAQGRPAGAGELRFDVVSIVRRRGSGPVITHLRGAF